MISHQPIDHHEEYVGPASVKYHGHPTDSEDQLWFVKSPYIKVYPIRQFVHPQNSTP